MKLLEKKVCIITGAAQGIGRSIAEQFAADGAIVYACDMKEGAMDEWATTCSDKYGTKIVPLYFDVTDAAAVKTAFIASPSSIPRNTPPSEDAPKPRFETFIPVLPISL